jgi:hypothetical protein
LLYFAIYSSIAMTHFPSDGKTGRPWQALVQLAAESVAALAAANDPSTPAHPWIERDPATGAQKPKMLLPPPETARQLADALSAQQSFRWRRRVMIGTTLILHIRSSELYAIMSEITPTGFRMLPRALVSALAAESACLRRKSSAAARDQTVADRQSTVL